MTPDIREKAERLLLELQSYAMDGNAYEGDHLSSELALPLISQALLEAHNAGRAEALVDGAEAWLLPHAAAVIADEDRAASFEAEGYEVVPLYRATAIRSIK